MSIRWRIADYLSRIACWLRGHEWYVAGVWHGVPGNRASELQQRIWQNCITLNTLHNGAIELDEIERNLDELSQAAGANWGHVWPKEKP